MPTKFENKCYEHLKKIPKGKVTTYKELAIALGMKPIGARAIGNAMRKNPCAPNVPCHRVVLSNGNLGNYSAEGGIKRKIELFDKEYQDQYLSDLKEFFINNKIRKLSEVKLIRDEDIKHDLS